MFTDTWLYQDGKAEGRTEGKTEGRTEATLKALRTVFELRFPGVAFPLLETVPDPATLEAALRAVVQASSAEEALAAIRTEVRTAG